MVDYIEKRWFGFFLLINSVCFVILFSTILFSGKGATEFQLSYCGMQAQSLAAVACMVLVLNYFLFFFYYKKIETGQKKVIFIFLSIIIIIMVLISNFATMDMISYSIVAKNYVVYNLNPYITEIGWNGNVWHKYISHIIWATQTSPYGPLFVLFSSIPIIIAGKSLYISIVLYKIINLFFLYIAFVYFKKIINFLDLENKELLKYLFILNPAILIHGVWDGHNDVILMMLLLIFVYFYLTGRVIKSIVTVVLGFLLKIYPIILIPALIYQKKKIQWRTIGLTALILIGLTLVVFAFFDFSFKEFLISSSYQSKITSACCGGYTIISLIYILFLEGHWLITVPTIIFALLYLRIYFLFVIKQENIIKFIFWTLVCLFFVKTYWLGGWYLIVLLPLALLLSREKMYLLAFLGLSFYSLMHIFF